MDELKSGTLTLALAQSWDLWLKRTFKKTWSTDRCGLLREHRHRPFCCTFDLFSCYEIEELRKRDKPVDSGKWPKVAPPP